MPKEVSLITNELSFLLTKPIWFPRKRVKIQSKMK